MSKSIKIANKITTNLSSVRAKENINKGTPVTWSIIDEH